MRRSGIFDVIRYMTDTVTDIYTKGKGEPPSLTVLINYFFICHAFWTLTCNIENIQKKIQEI